MHPRILAVIASLAVVAGALTGCAGHADAPGSDPDNPDQVEVFTWWTTGTEKLAYQALTNVFTNQNPGIEVIDASVRGGDGSRAREALTARLAADNPPDTFLAVAGAGLADYLEAGELQDLTGFYADNGLDGVFDPQLLELLSVKGSIYSVPSDVHRVNVVWTNRAVLENAGVDPEEAPADLDAWLADLQRVRDSGVRYPLALGNGWTQVQLFESVLISSLGATAYQQLWHTTAGWYHPSLQTAVSRYARLIEFADPRELGREASEVALEVVAGTAGYVLMADSAHASFQLAGYTWGEQFTSWPAPGTDGVFDLAVDSFALPVGAVHDAAAKRWLLSVGSAEAQQVLSYKLGSIPARADVDPVQFWPYQRTAMANLGADTVVASLSHGVAAEPGWTAAITDAVARFGDDRRQEALVNALGAAAAAAVG